jgi:hypothetical protein
MTPIPDLADPDYEALAAFRHALRCFTAFSESEARARDADGGRDRGASAGAPQLGG